MKIGKISSIDYDHGMVRVTYPDRGNSVSPPMPMLSEVYHMPQVGDLVLVAGLSNSGAGVVLGKFWTKENQPATSGKGVFCHQLGSENGQAVISYDGSVLSITTKGSLTLNGAQVIVNGRVISP